MRISKRHSLVRALGVVFALAMLFVLIGCNKKTVVESTTPTAPVDLQLKVKSPLRFVAYGDTRFHDPKDTQAANPPVRQALVQAIATENPAFVCFTGDIVYNRNDAHALPPLDNKTCIWQTKAIPVYPSPGNPDLHRDAKIAVGNAMRRLPRP